VTRGQLPQRAGSLGLNGGGTAAAVPETRAGCSWSAWYPGSQYFVGEIVARL